MAAEFLSDEFKHGPAGFCPARLTRISPWLKRYVDEKKLPFAHVAVLRKGQLAYSNCYGVRDIEEGSPILEDGIYRIYSMTKLVTTVAALALYEKGAFQLDDPVDKFVDEFRDARVFISGRKDSINSVEAETPMTIRQLMNHTSGLTYGAFDPGPVGQLMRSGKIDFGNLQANLGDTVRRLASIPLCFQPGSQWRYGVSTDVLGYVIEVVTGKTLLQVFDELIFKPLNMNDTFFEVPINKVKKFCSLYTRTKSESLKLLECAGSSRFCKPVNMYSGGGGLISSMRDYLVFLEMIRCGGRYDDAQILGRKTVELMLRNHLSGDMASMGQPTFSEMPMEGIGFGLGGAILLDPAKAQILGSEGEFTWGGMASTAFWIDPKEELSVVFMTQLIPSSCYPIRRELRVLVYQALVD
ncbi:MAG: serine hydrolase domain-containing protein [Pseudomonadota bacterium]|nr:serine hydrolase domain-containing protein [Pseudomonadota bacterium]